MNIVENNFSVNIFQCFMQVFVLLFVVIIVRILYCRECYRLDEIIIDDMISMRKMQIIVDFYVVIDLFRGEYKERLKIVVIEMLRIDMEYI